MSAIFNSILLEGINFRNYSICLITALVCGILVAFAASYKSYVSKSFIISLIVLPMIVETVIIMVNGNVGTGVAVMGAFSLVRFRSVPGKAKDIAAIFLSMTSGLACAAGYVWIALLFNVFVCAVLIVLANIPMGEERFMDLHITVPESLRFAKEFDDIFDEYTKKYRLVQTKTTNMGSLYKLQYKIQMKDKIDIQEFIDKLRCRNGNLEIAIIEAMEGSEEL